MVYRIEVFHPMLPSLLLLATLSLTTASPLLGLSEENHAVATVPPFKGEPAPPAWLFDASFAIAAVDTRHYSYEAYAGPKGQWLVRFLMLPEGNEAFREIEQAFLFTSDPEHKPQEVNPAEVAFDTQSSTWKKQVFNLVDRRDLMKP